jgi:predicted nucleotidyltransferase
MEIHITKNARISIKYFKPSKYASIKEWLFMYRKYNNITYMHLKGYKGFEFRVLGFGFGFCYKMKKR